jgi:hypothetical protein
MEEQKMERNLNKEVFDATREDKEKKRRGAIFAALLSLGMSGAPMEAKSHEVPNDPSLENLMEGKYDLIEAVLKGGYPQMKESLLKEKQEIVKEVEGLKQEMQKLQQKIDEVTPLIDSNKSVEVEPEVGVGMPKRNELAGDGAKESGRNNEALGYYKIAKEYLESNIKTAESPLSTIEHKLKTIEPLVARDEQILKEREQKQMAVHNQESDQIAVTVPKNLTAEQKETLKQQMDEMARKMIEQNHQQ